MTHSNVANAMFQTLLMITSDSANHIVPEKTKIFCFDRAERLDTLTHILAFGEADRFGF